MKHKAKCYTSCSCHRCKEYRESDYNFFGGFFWPKKQRERSQCEDEAWDNVHILTDFLRAIQKLKKPNKKIINRITELALKRVWCDRSATNWWELEQPKLTTKDALQEDLKILSEIKKNVGLGKSRAELLAHSKAWSEK